MSDVEILKALRTCNNDDAGCKDCPYYGLGSSSCLVQVCEDAAELIEKQKEQLEFEKGMRKLTEQDVADRDEMLKQKVEVVYADFMRDYKAMQEELEGVYEDLKNNRRDYEEKVKRLKEELSKKNTALLSVTYVAKRIPQAICDHCVPDFNRNDEPVNVWKAREGYAAVDALVEQIVKEAGA